MKFERIDSNARVWTVKRGSEGGLQHEMDPQLLASLYPEMSEEEIAEAIVVAAATAEIAETRAW